MILASRLSEINFVMRKRNIKLKTYYKSAQQSNFALREGVKKNDGRFMKTPWQRPEDSTAAA